MDRLLSLFFRTVLRVGALTVQSSSGRVIATGDGTGKPLKLTFCSRQAEWRMMMNPSLAFGELFMEGEVILEGGEVYDFVETGLRNFDAREMSSWLRLLERMRFARRRWQQNNHETNSRANVAHHYDLDRQLYSMFLDEDMQYSCAYFEHPAATLEEAQLAKKRHIAAKLLVDSGHKVLDIGCGWGGMGLYLARHAEAGVTGVTLSQEQLAVATERAAQASLEEKLDFRLQDYRRVEEKFDRVVSVGMLEHVGAGYLSEYFSCVEKLLNEDGVALIHTIGRPDGPGATNPWIAKYIFPGGYIPSLSELSAAIEPTGLLITDVEVLHLHYAETLKAWRERFMARREEARALYDERFCRMWEFYLAGSEASFRLGQQLVYQIQLAKREGVVPITRDYIGERERQLRARESRGRGFRLAGE